MLVKKISVILRKVRERLALIISSVFDLTISIILAPFQSKKNFKIENRPVLIFVGQRMQARIPRLAKWIRRTNRYTVILLTQENSYSRGFEGANFDHVIFFRNEYHLKRILKSFDSINIIHAFAPDYKPLKLVLDNTSATFVMDTKDMLVSYYGLNPPFGYMAKDMPYEKACLMEADGIVSHSMEIQNALRNYEITDHPPKLFFPLYLDNDSFDERPDRNYKVNELHIVYLGAVAGSHKGKHFGAIKFHGFIKKMEKQQIHFHIYPSPALLKEDYNEYIGISNESEFFHFHHAVKPEVLTAEIKNYHFGILPFFLEDTTKGFDKIGRSISMKIISYFEAGLPVIIGRDLEFHTWLGNQLGSSITIDKSDIDNLRSLIEKRDYLEMMDALFTKREKYSLKSQIPRLIQFYNKISS